MATSRADIPSVGTKNGLTCTYDTPYVRGVATTPLPPPEGDNGEARNLAKPFNQKGQVYRDKSWATRSCDHCRTHVIHCDGKQPCVACFKERIECTFKRRAQQRFSLTVPEGNNELEGSNVSQRRENARRRGLLTAQGGVQFAGTNGDGSGEDYQAMDDSSVDQVAQDIEPLLLPNRYGQEETPPLVFLHRAWRKIATAQLLGKAGQPGQPAAAAPGQLVLSSGDQPFNLAEPQNLPLEQEMWQLMQDKFAIGWTETFHFIHRPTARAWLNIVYRNWTANSPLEAGIGHGKACIALMTMALGTMFNNRRWNPGRKEQSWSWLWTIGTGDTIFLSTLRLTDSEPGPPALESVQARLLQVFYLLCTCRLSQAWYVFGNAVNMLTALGIHRRRGGNRGLGPEIVSSPEYAKVQCERRTFWSAYVLDRQLAMMSGRPAYFSLDAINQELPDCVNDEDMGRAGPFRPHKGDCYLEALVEQAKLAKISEKIHRQVYTLDDSEEEERLECALRLGKALSDWKSKLPVLMSIMKPQMLHLTWRRQQNMLQMAHWHAQILAYRPFMTAPYPADAEKRQTADFAIRTCIEAARYTLAMTVDLAREQAERDKSHFHTLLYPHHLTYLAASVIFLVPHIRQRQKLLSGRAHNYKEEVDARLFQLAQKAIKALVEGTNLYSPARRWAVILKELRDEAARQVPKDDGADQEREVRENTRESLDEQLLEDALRAHWEAELGRENPGNGSGNGGTQTGPAPAIVPRLWDKWKTTGWLDIDSAAFGPISSFERGEVPIAPSDARTP